MSLDEHRTVLMHITLAGTFSLRFTFYLSVQARVLALLKVVLGRVFSKICIATF